jgi:hypothetical protein
MRFCRERYRYIARYVTFNKLPYKHRGGGAGICKLEIICNISEGNNDLIIAPDQGRRSHGGNGGNCPHCPNSVGAARGQQVALFTGTALRNSFVIHRNWNL